MTRNLIVATSLLLLILKNSAAGQEYQFSNPSFSGTGWSSHVMTLEQMTQKNFRDERDRQEALERELQREIDNSNLNRFLNNFESRVYAQLSKMLVDRLFGDDPSATGEFMLGEYNISYSNDGLTIGLTITAPDGSNTNITIPIGALGL